MQKLVTHLQLDFSNMLEWLEQLTSLLEFTIWLPKYSFNPWSPSARLQEEQSLHSKSRQIEIIYLFFFQCLKLIHEQNAITVHSLNVTGQFCLSNLPNASSDTFCTLVLFWRRTAYINHRKDSGWELRLCFSFVKHGAMY